jgi:hypothetical protein
MFNGKTPDILKADDKTFLMSMAVCTSDLTNMSKRWTESYKWTCLVYEEFFVQGEEEKRLGITVGNLNDRNTVNIAEAQLGFIDFIVQPTFEVMALYLPKLQKNVEGCKSNRQKWSTMISECATLKHQGNNMLQLFKKIEIEEINETSTSKPQKLSVKKATSNNIDELLKSIEPRLPKTLENPDSGPTIDQRWDTENQIK